jgi:predicted  nucleic acid-binding Zn-ribbon protein
MTRRQANLISDMIRSQTTAAFHDARRELLESCEEQKSDAAAPQPSVTVTATSGQFEPKPPSTPQPVGFDYKYAVENVGSKDFTITRLQSEQAFLSERITQMLKEIASLKESVENRTKMIESLKKEIEALKKDLAEANTDTGLLIKKNNVIKELKDICDNRQGFIDKSIDIIDNLRKQLGDKSSKIDILKKEIEILGKQIENMKGFSRDDRDILYRKDFEIHALKTQVAVLVKNQQTITP